MPKLLWLGNPFFSPDLPALGWDLIYQPLKPGQVLDWDDCLRLADGKPDLLVVGDLSGPPCLVGQEGFACPTVFYAVDTHIHSWLPFYAQSFDACLVSLRDHLPRFQNQILSQERIIWSPPYALNEGELGRFADRSIACAFIGTIDPLATPLRERFFAELKQLLPDLLVRRGSIAKLYPQIKVAINFCEHGDLNFRVFESLGFGAALVTPNIDQGQDLLFRPGQDFLTYDPPANDSQAAVQASAKQAASQIEILLADPEQGQNLAASGFELVDKLHRRRNRAMSFSHFAQARLLHDADNLVRARQAKADLLHSAYLKMLYLHWAEHSPDSTAKAAYLRAAKRI